MFSSEDEQDENNIFDKLRSIKPFTIDQLYLLHPDVGSPLCLSATRRVESQLDQDQDYDKEVYQNLVEHEQLKHKLSEIKSQVKKIYKRTHDHVDNSWIFKEVSLRKTGLCQQGKIAEATFKYKQAFVSSKQLEMFAIGFAQLIDTISKDYIYYSFESQMKHQKIATKLALAYQIEDSETRRVKLKSSLMTLIEFIEHRADSRSDFVVQCRKWFRVLAKKLLEENTTDNYRFVISQLARGPAGTSDWSSDLIECKPFDRVTNFDSVPQYITHCSSLITQLFNSLRSRINRVVAVDEAILSDAESKNDDFAIGVNPNISADQNWSLVDPRFGCTEELNVTSSSRVLSEADVIKLCLRIPVAQIFRAYVTKCLSNSGDNFCLDTDKNYEYIMLKLLTIGTIIIKTYQVGLETFDSIQYGNLIEYLSSQIRLTVIILSEKWNEFKIRLRGIDDVLLMRLQVEYDNFMLRSILIILELRQSGIWRHLSRVDRVDCPDHDENICDDIEEVPQGWSTESLLRPAFVKLLRATGLSTQGNSDNSGTDEDSNKVSKHHQLLLSTSLTYEFSIEWFREISEPMLWHILWQFYHNAFVNSCDYNSDNYWIEKFREPSVVYLFIDKIQNSPQGECNYLLNSITSMLLSRTRPESKLVSFIATELFNLSYRHHSLRNKVTRLGTKSLIRGSEKFPNLFSLYLNLLYDMYCSEPGDLREDVIELVKGCSLKGWLCNSEEFDMLGKWLTQCPIGSTPNRLSRIIFSKILLNNSDSGDDITANSPFIRETPCKSYRRPSSTYSNPMPCSSISNNRFFDLNMRRKLALLLYEATRLHLPENNEFGPQSLGAYVEVAFGSLYCEQSATVQNNLIELATDTTYQQFYVWAWRLLFTLKLHILNQPETDWNDLKSRSGTSRSIKNTVLISDSFHPVPTIQDSECLFLAEGLKNRIPMASFVYLILTDVTWQTNTFEDCLIHLNILVNSGHITPSMMAMKFFTICHLSDLCRLAIKDKKCLDFFTTLVMGNFDATRLASLIMSQLDRLKQYRQLQLSQFYVHIFLEVANTIERRNSAAWFVSNELSLERTACLLDYLVKFNFTTQRLEIIHKFYDCAYVIQEGLNQPVGWFGSFLASNSINANTTKREFLTNLHALSQKFKKFIWLRWITAECDALRLEKIWEDIVNHLSSNEEANLDSAIRRVCPHVNASILKQILPIQSWIRQIFDIMESDLNHPLCPLIWYNFFLNYFANSLNGTSVGFRLLQQDTVSKLMSRLDALASYHSYKHRNRSISANSTPSSNQNSLAQLYRAYKLWLQDSSLLDAYVDMDRLSEDYLVPLLKAVIESSNGSDACLQYIDLQSINLQNKNLMQVWLTATRLSGNHLIKEMIFVDSTADKSMEILTSIDDEASDATTLIVKQINKSNANHHNHSSELKVKTSSGTNLDEHELGRPLRDDLMIQNQYRTFEEFMESIKKNFNSVFEEANTFNMNINELNKTKTEIIDLVQQLYTNKKRELVRVSACIEGNDCIGPARIKAEVDEATIDERKSHCIEDRRRQCQDFIGDLLLMPKSRSIQSTVIIEQSVKSLMDDPSRSRQIIETLLEWVSEPSNYFHLVGGYYVANHLLKTCLEILSANPSQADAYNTALMSVCLAHPNSVHIFSPHLSPSMCSNKCFLQLYKSIASCKRDELGPTASFVLLTKFDLNQLLDNLNKQHQPGKRMYHDMIEATCTALNSMGKDSDESYEPAIGLFRRHLQIELALPDRRRPEELLLVLSHFLHSMSQQLLAPMLWVDYMTIIGIETRRNQPNQYITNKLTRTTSTSIQMTSSTPAILDDSIISSALKSSGSCEHDANSIESIVDTISRQADCQTVFDYHSLDSLIKMLIAFMREQNECSKLTLLELYSEYLNNYGTFMLSVTFMWIRSVGEQYPDNHEIIWGQFMDLWRDWVFLAKGCQNVQKSSYSLVASYFVASISYMINKIPQNTQKILQSVLSNLAGYIEETKEVIYLELTILQWNLKNLPWSNLLAAPEDFEHLCALAEQENYNISDLVSHIVLQLDVKRSFSTIEQQENASEIIPRVSERLAKTIVLHSNHLKGYRLQGVHLSSIHIEHISQLADLILHRMETTNLEHSQKNKLLVNLLRFICIKLDSSSSNSSTIPLQQHPDDSFKRSIIYAQFVSNYLIDLIKRHPTVIQNRRTYLAAVLDNSLQDLKPLLLSSELSLSHKTVIYEALLECCSSSSLEPDQRLILSQLIFESSLIKNRPLVVLEILHASGQVLRDSRVLAETVEGLILIYLDMNGHYEKVWKSFCLKFLPSDVFLTSCIELRSSLSLLVYFESLVRGMLREGVQEPREVDEQLKKESMSENTMQHSEHSILSTTTGSNKIWANFFHWLAKLVATISSSNDSNCINAVFTNTKLIIILPRVLELFEPNLHHFVNGHMQDSCEEAALKQVTCTQVDSTCENDERQLIKNNLGSPSEKKLNKKQQISDASIKVSAHHICFLELINQLISLYDSLNSASIWTYLSISSTRNEHSVKISITALAVASFLVDRTLANLSLISDEEMPERLLAFRQEVAKYRKTCLLKLEGARKSKIFINCVQFIETVIECIERSGDRVQYIEGVQLITTYVRLAFNPQSSALVQWLTDLAG